MSKQEITTPQFILFVMANGDKISVDAPQAMRILTSNMQQVMVQEDGTWTGYTINKAHIVDTKPDFDRIRSEAQRAAMKTLKLAAPPMTEEQMRESRKRWDAMREELVRKKVLRPRRMV